METAFLNLIEYEVNVGSQQFAKYSFIMDTLRHEETAHQIASPTYKKENTKKHIFESERVNYKHRSRVNHD